MRAVRLLDRIAVANARIDPVDRRAVVEGGRRDRRRFPERGHAAAFPPPALGLVGEIADAGQAGLHVAIDHVGQAGLPRGDHPPFVVVELVGDGRKRRRLLPGLRHVAGIEGLDGEALRDQCAGFQHVEIVVETGELRPVPAQHRLAFGQRSRLAASDRPR